MKKEKKHYPDISIDKFNFCTNNHECEEKVRKVDLIIMPNSAKLMQ